MLDWLELQGARELVPLVSVIGGVIFLTSIIVAGHWEKVRRAETQARVREAELALKHDLLECGMSADDIVRVIEAGQKKAAKDAEDASEPSAAAK
ncbi:MAG: hypothetical protein EXS16_01925 [Gemmataceae bacterium]|nr:hypothetical protein [Gemmataceae bacterium]